MCRPPTEASLEENPGLKLSPDLPPSPSGKRPLLQGGRAPCPPALSVIRSICAARRFSTKKGGREAAADAKGHCLVGVKPPCKEEEPGAELKPPLCFGNSASPTFGALPSERNPLGSVLDGRGERAAPDGAQRGGSNLGFLPPPRMSRHHRNFRSIAVGFPPSKSRKAFHLSFKRRLLI